MFSLKKALMTFAHRGLENLSPISQKHSYAYRPDIDGLRAMAILAVLIFHYFPHHLPGGFIGVDMFFVISGFLISNIIFSDLKKNQFSFLDFYARRVRRIYPALILLFLCCLFYGWLVLYQNEFENLGKTLFFASTFLANFSLYKSTAYFDMAGDKNPLLHLWSLAVEEQFYIGWPIFLYIMAGRLKKFLFLMTLFGFALSFFLNIIWINKNPTLTFYMLPMRAWEFLIGCFLAFPRDFLPIKVASFCQRINIFSKSKGICSFFSMTGIVILVAGFFLIQKDFLYPGWYALVPTFGTALIIYSGMDSTLNQKFLSWKPWVFIGLISYPLYITHWPLISFGRIIIGEPGFLAKMMMIFASGVLAWSVYRYIERPVRQKKGRMALFLVSIMIPLSIISYQVYSRTIHPYVKASNPEIYSLAEGIDDWVFPGNNFRNLLNDYKGIYFYQYEGSLPQTVVFFGDSNMQQYAARFDKLIEDKSKPYKSFVWLTHGGYCPVHEIKTDNKVYVHHDAFIKNALEEAKKDHVTDIVLGGYWVVYFTSGFFYFQEGGERFPIKEGTTGQEKAFRAFEKLIKDFMALGKRVHVILNMPSGIEYDPLYMMSRDFWGHHKTTDLMKYWTERKYPATNEKLKSIALGCGAIVIDPYKFLCKEKKCQVLMPSHKPLYKDNIHFASSYVRDYITFLDHLICN